MTAPAPPGVKPAEDNPDLTLEAARATVRHEAAALEQLAAHLDSAFVHAAEAHHGDLGMVVPDDTLVAISFSGATVEVLDFARAVRERGSSIIAIVGRPDSELGRLADHTLLLHVEIEADPIGVTPTTSSTATLALGDALAVALMTLSGFDVAQFRRHHPGGHLGERLRSEEERPPVTIPASDGV
ncbi:MAG TPA: SIS domain-containing protein [Nocardioidaceae bacterium]|nr:SIS domain-containing protein [Nocardioidaceae bacterium]